MLGFIERDIARASVPSIAAEMYVRFLIFLNIVETDIITKLIQPNKFFQIKISEIGRL